MRLLFQWLLVLFAATISTTVLSRSPDKLPRLSLVGPFSREPDLSVSSSISDELKTFFYNQTIDHFNYKPESYATFRQRYLISSKFWGGANESAPIFAYLGAEGPIDSELDVIGFLHENAPHFRALMVYIEHRYYGESNPLGSMEESVKKESTRGYFNSAQAIADYAEILLYLKEKLQAPNSPVVVIGGSYGGMLASWFRLKYPHIAVGALASSAPILYFDGITSEDGYYSMVTKDFRDASESCYMTIKKSWDEIDRVASQPNGLSILSQKFKTCTPLKGADELENYLSLVYSTAAQYNEPPAYPTTQVCRGIDGAGNATNILDQIFAGLVAYIPDKSCYNTTRASSQTNTGWKWQVSPFVASSYAFRVWVSLTCSEMVFPIGITRNDSMFPPSPYSLSEFVAFCNSTFGISPRPHWVTTYYGGHDIKLVLNKFGSNMIFSNGLKDPYSTGGVLEDISDSILAVHTTNGSHCLDILKPKATDPDWLLMQRKTEIQIIEGWFKNYYDDLLAFKK